MSVLIICIATFVSVAALVGAGVSYYAASAEGGIENRLDLLTGATSAKQAKEALLKGSVLSQPLDGTQHAVWDYLSRLGNLQLLFEQADTTLTAPQFFGISGAMALVGMFVPVL